jgi:hypothetical protein
MRNAYKSLAGKPEGETALRRPRCGENTTMHLREIGWEGADSMHPSQDREQWQAHTNMATNIWDPQNEDNLMTEQ